MHPDVITLNLSSTGAASEPVTLRCQSHFEKHYDLCEVLPAELECQKVPQKTGGLSFARI